MPLPLVFGAATLASPLQQYANGLVHLSVCAGEGVIHEGAGGAHTPNGEPHSG